MLCQNTSNACHGRLARILAGATMAAGATIAAGVMMAARMVARMCP